jgi:hypothetical protein
MPSSGHSTAKPARPCVISKKSRVEVPVSQEHSSSAPRRRKGLSGAVDRWTLKSYFGEPAIFCVLVSIAFC